MFHKFSAVALLAAIAIFALPTAANAAYVPANQGGAGTTQSAPGAPETVAFTAGAFSNSEQVRVTVTGDPEAALGVVRALASNTKDYPATRSGALSFTVTVPTNAPANAVYNVTATGVTSGNVGTHTITVVTADSKKGLAFTGGTVPVVIIWGGAGVLLLGIALLVVFGVVRRQRLSA